MSRLQKYMTVAELEQHLLEKRAINSSLDELSGGFCPGEIRCMFRTSTEYKVLSRLSGWERFWSFNWVGPDEGNPFGPTSEIKKMAFK